MKYAPTCYTLTLLDLCEYYTQIVQGGFIGSEAIVTLFRWFTSP